MRSTVPVARANVVELRTEAMLIVDPAGTTMRSYAYSGSTTVAVTGWPTRFTRTRSSRAMRNGLPAATTRSMDGASSEERAVAGGRIQDEAMPIAIPSARLMRPAP